MKTWLRSWGGQVTRTRREPCGTAVAGSWSSPRPTLSSSPPTGTRFARLSCGTAPQPGWLRAWPDGRVSYEAPLDVGRGHVVDLARSGATRHGLEFRIESVSPDGDLVLTADRSRVDLVRLQLRDSTRFRPVGEEMTVSSFDGGVDWTSDGRSFVIGAGEMLQVRDRRGRLLRELSGAHSGAVMAPVFPGADDSVLWAAGRDGLASGSWRSGSRVPRAATVGSGAFRSPPARGWSGPAPWCRGS